MQTAKLLVSSALAFAMLCFWPPLSPSASMEQLVAGARKEGAIEFYATSNLTPKGAQELREAFNKKYGINVSLSYTPGGNMAGDIAKVVSRSASGLSPEWDLMIVTDAHHARLYLRKLLEPFDYGSLGIDAKMVHYDGGAVAIANQIVLPAYNKKFLPAQDVPKSWEDLLEPKWKGGKLGMGTSVHHLARLAAGPWGEEKTTRFVRGLAEQKPVLGSLGDIFNRLQLGEVQIAITLTDTFINTAKRTGAPIVHAEGIEPIVSPAWHAGVPKGAERPNVAHLFVAFLATPEAQLIWEKYNGQTSAFVSGTTTYEYARGKKMVYMSKEQAETVDRLDREYSKILGFRQ
jgi:iron(III) transport system substrate-binding protein